MRNIILLLLCFAIMFSHGSVYAKIIADQEFNDSVVFYFWDNWGDVVGFGTGSYWISFVKHIDKTGVENYWLRLDSNRRDTIAQYGKIITPDKEYNIEAVDNPTGLQQRSGIGNRVVPHNVPVHAFYNTTPDVIQAIANSNGNAKIIINFQARKDIPLIIHEKIRTELKQLIMLTRSDYSSYYRKP